LGADEMTVEQLITAFSAHPCCAKDNCVVNILNLPYPADGYCGCCFPKSNFCGPVGGGATSTESRHSEVQLKAAFMHLVVATRAPWMPHRSGPSDSKERRREKKRAADDDLMTHFRSHGKQISGVWDWSDAYYTILPSGQKQRVCKTAWCAISGNRINGVEYAQKRIADGQKPSTGRMDDPDAVSALHVASLSSFLTFPSHSQVITIDDAFKHFGIDVDNYHSHIQAFCYVTEIPENESALVCAAYLADYFELVGEAQPGAVGKGRRGEETNSGIQPHSKRSTKSPSW
jgi:hypothetical protein